MGDSKKDVRKLKEELKKLLEKEKLDDAKMAEMQAKLDTMSPDPYKDLAENYEEFKKKYQWQPEDDIPSPHVCEDPNAHYDVVAAKCICNTGYVLDAVSGKCIKSVGGEPPEPTQTGDKDANGIIKIYQDKQGGSFINSDQFKPDDFERNYASGKPSEWSYENEFKSSTKTSDLEVTYYVKINGFKTNESDTLSIKLLGPDHQDGKGKSWLIYQISTDGKPDNNFQIESPHPSNHDNHQKTKFDIGASIIGKWIGVKAITFKEGDDRKAFTYVDFPVADINNPPNKWREYIGIDSVKGLEKGFVDPTGGNILLRIDGVKKDSLPDVKYQSAREITSSLSTGSGTGPAEPTPEPTPEPPKAGQVYDSNKEGGWNNGSGRVVTKSDGDISPNGKGFEMHASGNPQLVLDGKGVGVLECKPGHGRAYFFVKNYNGILEEEVMFDANVENHTIQTRSRHQEGGEGPNRFGGLSAKVSPVDVGLKIERFHNEHLADIEKPLKNKLALGQWHKIKYTFNDTADGKGIFQKLEVNGEEVISQTVTTGIEPYFQDKASFDKNSYFWLRMNNTKDAKLGIRNVRMTLT